MTTPLADWMRREGLSPEEAAARIGCDRSTLVRILPGRDGSRPKRRPGWKLLERIVAATAGQVTADDFLIGVEHQYRQRPRSREDAA